MNESGPTPCTDNVSYVTYNESYSINHSKAPRLQNTYMNERYLHIQVAFLSTEVTLLNI